MICRRTKLRYCVTYLLKNTLILWCGLAHTAHTTK